MAEIVGVRFKGAGKVYYFDPDDKALFQGGICNCGNGAWH